MPQTFQLSEQSSEAHHQFLILVQATPEHLDAVLEAQATAFVEATGSDPRQTDPEGFRRRTLERIERGRTWIKLANDTVVFKAELQSVTPDVISGRHLDAHGISATRHRAGMRSRTHTSALAQTTSLVSGRRAGRSDRDADL